MGIISQQVISLKDRSDINEASIRDFIFDDPSVLGLGQNLQPITKELQQPQGGRLDLLLGDDDGNRYEVELQLGDTDPSHIIRTLEYWDTERKRYPKNNHTAVIIAEGITSRFQNVISLFNSEIPLIALQLTATETEEGDIAITFVKVMDVVDRGTDEEYFVPTDRSYWENKSTKKILELVDSLFDELGERKEGYELKYNKFYVGLAKDNVANNFICFVPKKSHVWLRIRTQEHEEITERLEQAGMDIKYDRKNTRYDIKLTHLDDFRKHSEDILLLIDSAKAYCGAD